MPARENDQDANYELEDVNIKPVKKFKYFGSVWTVDGKCHNENQWRIGIAKDGFPKISKYIDTGRFRDEYR